MAALEAAIRASGLLINRRLSTESKEEVRLSLGLWLSLALELEIAADIVRTAIAPGWEEIGKLAAIMVLRTVLNYFLQTELSEDLRMKTPRSSESAQNKSVKCVQIITKSTKPKTKLSEN